MHSFHETMVRTSLPVYHPRPGYSTWLMIREEWLTMRDEDTKVDTLTLMDDLQQMHRAVIPLLRKVC